MTVGSPQLVIVCAPSADGASQSPCPAGQAISVVSGYLLDPSAQTAYEASFASFDYTVAASIWSLAFTFVVGLYLVSKSVGTVLATIRR